MFDLGGGGSDKEKIESEEKGERRRSVSTPK